jgi:hypothetical protein
LAAWIYDSISNRALQNPFSYLYVDEALTDAIYPHRERLPAREPVPEGTVVVEDSRHVGSKRLEYRREDEIEWLKNLMERAEGSEEVLSQRRDSEDPARFARLGASGSAGVSGSQKKRESSQKNKEAGEASESQKSKKKPKANWFLEQETPEPVAEPIVEPAPDPTPEPAPEPMEMDNGGSAEENQAEEDADVRRSPRKSAKGKERAEERISPPTESQQKQKKRKEREPEPEQREEEPESSGEFISLFPVLLIRILIRSSTLMQVFLCSILTISRSLMIRTLETISAFSFQM